MRRLLALLQGLPPDSAIAVAATGSDWTTDTMLLAAIADRVGIAASAEHRLKKPPDPIPRPSLPRKATAKPDAEALAAFFGGPS